MTLYTMVVLKIELTGTCKINEICVVIENLRCNV